jgi:hypothetical protein
MISILDVLLKIAGAGLIALALLHVPIGRKLRWREEARLMTPVNAMVFHVHTLFVCLMLVMMGLPCLLETRIFLDPSPAGRWISWSFALFWAARLYCQFFVYRADLWHGKRMETVVHWIFTGVWIALTGVFTACGLIQSGWL